MRLCSSRRAALRERSVRDVLRERVLEVMFEAACTFDRIEELRCREPPQARVEVVRRRTARFAQQRMRHRRIDDGCDLQQRLVRRRELIDARGEHGLDGRGNARFVRIVVEQLPGELFQEERIALCLVDDAPDRRESGAARAPIIDATSAVLSASLRRGRARRVTAERASQSAL